MLPFGQCFVLVGKPRQLSVVPFDLTGLDPLNQPFLLDCLLILNFLYFHFVLFDFIAELLSELVDPCLIELLSLAQSLIHVFKSLL